MKKIVVCMVMVLGFLGVSLTISNGASAATSVQIDRGKAVYNEELGKYVIPLKVVNGDLVPKTLSEIIADRNSPVVIDNTLAERPIIYNDFDLPNVVEDAIIDTDVEAPTDQVAPIDPITTLDVPYYEKYKYTREMTRTISRPSKKVSGNINCTTSKCSISKAVSVNVSQSFSANVSGDSKAIKLIKAGAGFTWVSGASDTTTYTFHLVKGESGAIYFTPLNKKTVGELKITNSWNLPPKYKTVTGYSVKKTGSGDADGEYYFGFN